MSLTLNSLQALGFAAHSHEPHFGHELIGVTYLYRTFGANHQYVSLIAYDGLIIESVLEVYYAAKLTKKVPSLKTRELQEKGFAPLAARLYWTEDDLIEAVGQAHSLPPKADKKNA